jgi:hypothetical protein
MIKKIKKQGHVLGFLLLALGLFALLGGQTFAAGPLDKEYTYNMSSIDLRRCKAATPKAASGNQSLIDICVVKVTAYCNDFDSPLYKNACFGKYFGLGDCRQSGSTSMAQMATKQCKEKNTFICAAQPQASFKTSCQDAGKSQLFGILVQNSSGGSTEAGGGSIPPAGGGGTSTGSGTVDATTPSDETPTATKAELEAAAAKLRDKLAKGKNTCGSSKTVFKFNCANSDNAMIALILAIVKFLTYGVGIVITLSVVISGLQYATAQSDPSTVAKARTRIFNAVIALLLYVFAFAILNYLVPGGLISG